MIAPEQPARHIGTSVVITMICAILAGLALGYAQDGFIFKGLSYCLDTQLVYDDAGPRFAALMVIAVRVLCYGLLLPAATAVFLMIFNRTPRTRRVIGVGLSTAAFAVVLFVADYSIFNNIEFYAKYNGATEKVAQRCPDNRPPWWPL